MHLTSADARAAREGFHFVVMRGGKRVAYTTTAAEAKRECGKGCKVYPLARMRYTAQNPANKQALLASLDRRIEAAERAGMPVAYMLEQRDLLVRSLKAKGGKKANPRRNPSFARWLDTFLEEKEIDPEEVLEVKGKQWGTNYIPVGVLVQAMKRAPKHEQEAIKTMLVKIDFRNAPVRPYLAHLGQAIARNPRRNPDWASYGSAVAKGVHTAAKVAVPTIKKAGHYAVVGLKAIGRGLASFARGFARRHAEELPQTSSEIRARIAQDAEAIRQAEEALKEQEKVQRQLYEEGERIRRAKEALEREKLQLEVKTPLALPPPAAVANPGLTKAGKRHLIQTMHRAGADTFRKKMAYVRRHMPHVTDPAAFVGYVMQGEKR